MRSTSVIATLHHGSQRASSTLRKQSTDRMPLGRRTSQDRAGGAQLRSTSDLLSYAGDANGSEGPEVGATGSLRDDGIHRPGAFPAVLGQGPQVVQGLASGVVQESPSHAKRTAIKQNGVKQWIYTNWIKDEIEREAACLELPFTILLLVAFSVLTLWYINQETITIVEEAIVNDIEENANFAWAHHFGHKGIYDVNSLADFWSWTRLGFVPLVAPSQPWPYSEELESAVPRASGRPRYEVAALPTRWPVPGHRRPVPVRNDYLRYNRIIGGFRFRQSLAEPSVRACVTPGDPSLFRQWLGKPCFFGDSDYLEPDLFATETMDAPQRVEWFLMEVEDHDTLIRRVMDMEDGCTAARFHNRTCLCETCGTGGRPHPWLDELTTRVEISFVLYNAQYGIYCVAVINFWFSRTGQIHKLINIRSSWAGLMVREFDDMFAVVVAGIIWLFSIGYVAISEIREILELVRNKAKPWYLVIADDYIDFWNCVDWVSFVIAMVITGLFMVVNHQVDRVNASLALIAQEGGASVGDAAEYSARVMDFYDTVEDMTQSEWQFRLGCCVYPVIVMLRLFKSFAAQPRLAVVTRTFTTAWADLSHFALVFFSVYLCMAANAILFFGQDVVDFATMDRALHSCFMAMLGAWDWDAMKRIGLMRAFLWFFTFMLIMVMLLLNMLLAILMESYSQVKAQSENEASLPAQIQNLIRRANQNRRGERIRLKDIWSALLRFENNDDEAMLKSERLLFPRFLLDIVPYIGKEQAERTLTTSQTAYDLLNQEPLDPDELKGSLERMEERMDNMVLCVSWLSSKLQHYDGQLGSEQRPALEPGYSSDSEGKGATGVASEALLERQAEEEEAALRGALEAVRQIVEERTLELASGVAAVLGEEMQCLEKRQGEQRVAMQRMEAQLRGLQRLILKLRRTCQEVSFLASTLERGASEPAAASGGRAWETASWLEAPTSNLSGALPARAEGLRSRAGSSARHTLSARQPQPPEEAAEGGSFK